MAILIRMDEAGPIGVATGARFPACSLGTGATRGIPSVRRDLAFRNHGASARRKINLFGGFLVFCIDNFVGGFFKPVR